MDYQNREGGKTGSGGLLSKSESNAERRDRLRKLAMETIDLTKDPYFMKNHLGTYECRLCLTIHTNEGSYLGHTQGKKHQANLGRRAAREASQGLVLNTPGATSASTADAKKKSFIKIGMPGYRIIKLQDPLTKYHGLFFQVHFPKIKDTIIPLHRFMSAFEQKVEPANRLYQYMIVAAEPYENIAFKIPSKPMDKSEGACFSHWNKDDKLYMIQVMFCS